MFIFVYTLVSAVTMHVDDGRLSEIPTACCSGFLAGGDGFLHACGVLVRQYTVRVLCALLLLAKRMGQLTRPVKAERE